LETNFFSQYQYIAEVPRVKMALAPAPRLAPVTVANTELRVPSERADAIGSEHGAEQDYRNPGQLDRQDRPDATDALKARRPPLPQRPRIARKRRVGPIDRRPNSAKSASFVRNGPLCR
jgi:hypothetical protein